MFVYSTRVQVYRFNCRLADDSTIRRGAFKALSANSTLMLNFGRLHHDCCSDFKRVELRIISLVYWIYRPMFNESTIRPEQETTISKMGVLGSKTPILANEHRMAFHIGRV